MDDPKKMIPEAENVIENEAETLKEAAEQAEQQDGRAH